MRKLFLIINVFLIHCVFAQSNVDSLVAIIKNKSTKDSIKAVTYNQLALTTIYTNPDSAYFYAQESNKLSTKNNFVEPMIASLDHMARIWWIRGQLDSSLSYIYKKLKIYEELKDQFGMSASANNLGMIAENKGDFPQALIYYMNAIRILEGYKNVKGQDSLDLISTRLASTYNNVGNIYARQNNNDDGRRYYKMALEINSRLNSERKIAVNYTNLGICDYNDNLYSKAIKKYNKALEIHVKFNDKYGMSEVYQNMGHSYVKMNKLHEAENNYLNAIEIQEEIKDDYGLCSSYIGMSNVYYLDGQDEKALNYALKAKKIAREQKFAEFEINAYDNLSRIYYQKDDYKNAYLSHVDFSSAKDSIFNAEKNKQIEELKTSYDTEKKEQEIALLNKDKKLKELELVKKDETIKQQRIKNVLYAVVAISLFIVSIVFRRAIVQKKRDNKIIQEQKNIVEEANEELNQQNEEILAQRDEIEQQKKVVDLKNKELVSGINAAERIQRAFFTYEKKEQKYLPEHFIFFKPLGIVSGDFYWFNKQETDLYIAVADCTGHGVPGALMSMLGASYLSEIISTNKGIDPGQVLDLLKSKIVKELNQNELSSSNKEGMDISMVRFNIDSLEIQFAGANNPLYIYREREKDIEIFKGDRQPIGYSSKVLKFENHHTKVEKGDVFYLFSDGYADQFGGEQGAKMGSKRFKNKLVQINSLTMKEQKRELERFFKTWKGVEDQVDDVCVAGFKI